MEAKKKRDVPLVVYLVIVLILGIIFGRLFAETVKLIKVQEQIKDIEAQYNEITKEYEALRATYINEI